MRPETAAEIARGALRAYDEAEAQRPDRELTAFKRRVTSRSTGEVRWVTEYGRQEPPTITALRRAVRRHQLEADMLCRAADELPACGRGRVVFRCSHGHTHQVVRTCRLATLCPDCARAESARLSQLYAVRVRALLARSPGGVRARMVTLALRPKATETLPDVFERCRLAGKRVLRVLWGVPLSAADWRLYRRVFPLHPRETAAAGGRERTAWAARRRRVEADSRRRLAGWLIASEFGERGMKAHVHALVVGRWHPQARIAEAWRLATGDSSIVDVRLAHDVKEVTKYAVKFFTRSPEELASLYRATCGRRRIEAVGQLRGAVEGERPEREPVMCGVCGEVMQPWGLIPPALVDQGVEVPPDNYLFRSRRARAGP